MKAGMHGYQHPTAKGKKASDAQLEKLKPKGLQQMLDVVDRLTTLATVMNDLTLTTTEHVVLDLS